MTGVALTLRSNGARRPVWVAVLGGVLLDFHAAGPLPVAGLCAFAIAVFVADRQGVVPRIATDRPEVPSARP